MNSELPSGPQLFRHQDWFHKRQFFHGQGGEGGFQDDSGALHLLCTLLFLYQLHLRSSDIRSQRLGTPILGDRMQRSGSPTNISKIIKERERKYTVTMYVKTMSLKVYALKVKGKQRADTLYRNFQSCFQVTHGMEVLKGLQAENFFFQAENLCIIVSFKKHRNGCQSKVQCSLLKSQKKSFVLSGLK